MTTHHREAIIEGYHVKHKEGIEHAELDIIEVDIPEYNQAEVRKILRKIDFRLLPMLCCFFLFAFLDRGNIGNAKVAGMQKDLKLTGTQYNIILTVFFIPYSLLEVPCNIILKLVRPNIWIASLMLAWGTVMTLMGLVQGFSGLLAARWFLGVAESGFFPAAAFLLTLFYKRYEVLKRLAVFYSCASFSGAFSGLLAFALEKMDGIGGLAGWRWIFIIEGLLPVIGSVVAYFLVPNSPETCSFLSQEERNFIVYRLQVETGSGRGRVTNSDKLNSKQIRAALGEWKTWAAVVVFWGCCVSVYAFTYTIPTVILELGYTAADAQLMTIPVYVVAMGFVVGWAFISDRTGVRSTWIFVGFCFATFGLIGLLSIPHPKMPGLTYFFLFPVAIGIYCPQQLIISWTANNAAPSSKRAVSMALLISVGNMGGICGSNIFLQNQAPRYFTGYGVCLGFVISAQIMTLYLKRVYTKINKERDLMSEEEIITKYTEAELLQLGDKSPYFRYTL